MGGRIDLNVVAWAASKWVVDDSLSDYYPPAIEAAVWRPPTAEWVPPNYDSDNPNFCPYHRILGHPIEDCWVFKDRVER
jgi:hypothetical protein